MSQEQIHQVEVSIEQARKAVAMSDALRRLRDNKDFKMIIEEGYFKDEASRLVLVKADVNMQAEEHQREIDNQISAIGYLFSHFKTLFAIGTAAKNSIAADEQTLEELYNEDQDTI